MNGMKTIILVLLGILALLCIAEACDIKLKLVSKTDKPVKFQVIVPGSKIRTEEIELKRKQKKLIQIKGKNCGSKIWIFKMWVKKGKQWKKLPDSKMRLDGNGWTDVNIEDSRFHFFGSFGILTSGI
uniref:Uncharacterized protein n=1 Tax=Syphacia muris TaxID=451379 RepID=A0A0N5AQ82_9BILA